MVDVRRVNRFVFVDDETKTRYLVSNKVFQGSQGSFHLVRQELYNAPSVLFGAKQVCIDYSEHGVATPQDASLVPQSRSSVAREITAMTNAGSPIAPTLVLREGDRLFQLGPVCDGDLFDAKASLHRLAPDVFELVLADIVRQVARRLVECHRQSITHRDIKPDNILFLRTGEVFLADYGLTVDTGQTEGVAGTVGFIAPEHSDEKPVDTSLDIWSLGCTLLDLILCTPFDPRAQPAKPVRFANDDFVLNMFNLQVTKVPEERYRAWLTAFKRHAERNDGSPIKTRYPEFDKAFTNAHLCTPRLFGLLLRMLAFNSRERPTAAQVFAEIDALFPQTASNAVILKNAWRDLPRSPDLEKTLRRWCEPHLQPLRRTTSADNLLVVRGNAD